MSYYISLCALLQIDLYLYSIAFLGKMIIHEYGKARNLFFQGQKLRSPVDMDIHVWDIKKNTYLVISGLCIMEKKLYLVFKHFIQAR